MTANYFRNCHAMILVYDASPDRLDTLFALRYWISDVRKHSSLNDKVFLTLWANKADLTEGDAIPPEVEAFMAEHNIPSHLHYNVSAKDGTELMQAFHALILHVDQRGLSPTIVGSSRSLSNGENAVVHKEEKKNSRGWRQKCRC